MKRTNQMENGAPSFSSFGLRRSASRGAHLIARNFFGLSLELSARTVMNNETVLPKAAETAGIMKPRLSLGVASAAAPRCAATESLERRVVSKQ